MSPHPARSKYTAAMRSMPPQTRGLPLVGALPAFARQPLDFLLSARQRYGDIYTLDLGLLRWVILNHPRHAEYILSENSQNYRKGGDFWNMLRTMYGNGLVVSEGDFWLRQRRMIQPHFHRKQLAGLTEAMVSAVMESLGSWEAAAAARQPFELVGGFAGISMRVITRALFGQGLGQADMDSVTQNMAFIVDYLMLGAVTYTLPRWLPVPGSRRYQQSLREIDALVAKIIAHERNATIPSDSLLAMMLHMVDEESGEAMTDTQLRDEVLTFFMAGYDTTSLSMTWTLYLLAQHPQIMQKLRAEVDTVLAGRAPTFADLGALSYTRMVIQESMRLRPPSWWVPRTAIADDVIDGYAIPAGTTVVVLTYGLHNHPDLWDDPQRFDPERFTNERVAQRHRLAWMPFSAGQRQCIGKDFAIMESQLMLAMLMQRYTVTAIPGHVVQPKLSSMLRPNRKVLVHLEKRGA